MTAQFSGCWTPKSLFLHLSQEQGCVDFSMKINLTSIKIPPADFQNQSISADVNLVR